MRGERGRPGVAGRASSRQAGRSDERGFEERGFEACEGVEFERQHDAYVAAGAPAKTGVSVRDSLRSMVPEAGPRVRDAECDLLPVEFSDISARPRRQQAPRGAV